MRADYRVIAYYLILFLNFPAIEPRAGFFLNRYHWTGRSLAVLGEGSLQRQPTAGAAPCSLHQLEQLWEILL